MTVGAIIFAQNNSSIDYTKLAVYASKRIKKYLDIPVSLVTDNPQWLLDKYPDHIFDQVIEIQHSKNNQQKRFYDGSISSKILDWKNLSRSQVYELTPYDRTLVIDSDYIINSSILKSALYNEFEFQIYKKSIDLAGWRPVDEFDRINQYSIPFYWATTFIFEKNQVTATFFDLISYIKTNWSYFRVLYSIDSSTFRNDFAFSIAIHIMNGKANGDFAVELPGTMIFLTDRDVLVESIDNKMKFLLEKKGHLGEYVAGKTTGLDLHVMNKSSLLRIIDEETNV